MMGTTEATGVRRVHHRVIPLVVAALLAASAPALSATHAPTGSTDVRQIRTVHTVEFGVPRPAGLAYDPGDDTLLVAATEGQPRTLIALDRTARLAWSSQLGPGAGAILTVDADRDLLAAVGERWVTTYRIASLAEEEAPSSQEVLPRGVTPAGAAFNDRGELLVLDAAANRVLVLDPSAPQSVRRTIHLDVPGGQLVGLARRPADGLLFVAQVDEQRLYGFQDNGKVAEVYDYGAETDLRDPVALAFAPSSDTTDAAATTHLFVADGGDATSLGGVTEFRLVAEEDTAGTLSATATQTEATSVPTNTLEHVQTIHTSEFDPPSPDPAGVTYIPSSDRLIIVDSEVNETTGAGHTTTNLWQLDRHGVVDHSGDTLEYSDEPTGLGYDPDGGRLFISSDDDQGIYVVQTGADGLFGTADDARSFIDVAVLGVTDAEDPAFDPTTGALFFLDGISTEVYRIDPVNDVFGDADDLVSHFDVGQFGISDAEALGFDPERETLVVGDRRGKTLYEVTREGELLQIMDVSSASELSRISGLTVAPTSSDPTELSYWIVDRAVDNGSDPNENDGKLFEFARALSTSPPAVTITEPADGANVIAGEPVTFTAEAVDAEDGDLSAHLSWNSDLDGALGTGASITATLATGTHLVTATVTDTDGMTGEAQITVHSTGENGPFILERVVTNNADDAEESLVDGSMSLGSSDLELGADGATPQRVGMRFLDVQVPVGATITSAHIQFQVDETDTKLTDLVIEGEAAADPLRYSSTTADITSRSRTAAVVGWQPPSWTVVGEAGSDQRTPDLGAIVTELVEQPDWMAGNAMAFMATGTGERTAEAADAPDGAPVLTITYTTDGEVQNTAPQVTASADSTFLGSAATLTGNAIDDGLPDTTLTAQWSLLSGPGDATFADQTALSTTAEFDALGEYELELRVDDGELAGTDRAVLTVVDPAAPPAETARFGLIADLGDGTSGHSTIADLLTGLDPEFIVTAGDNVYSGSGYDDDVGRFYADYIGDYGGRYGDGAYLNALFPALGDEDLGATGGLAAYEAFYTLPGGGLEAPASSGNERYYDVVRGPVHVFVINSNGGEPDGRDVGSVQYEWLREGLAASTSAWQVVVLHEPPYSSGGSKELMQWPYAEWGADAVVSGHRHYYERLQVGGIPYIVNGLGGSSISGTPETFLAESQVFYNASHGVILAEACQEGLTLTFTSLADGVVDTHTIGVHCDAPTAPSDLSATASDGAVELAWTDASDDETGFEVERDDGADDGFEPISTVAADVTTFVDAAVDGGVEYCYRVRALGVAGPSAYTDVACATTTGNSAPVAVDDSAETPEDVPVTIDVLANDTDAEGDPLTLGTLTQPTDGTAVTNPDHTITYIPDADFSGTDTFTYTASDGTTESEPATVTITVTPVDDPPVAADDQAEATTGTPISIEVLANDTDPDDDLDPASVSVTTAPGSGTAVAEADGTVTYTSASDFEGTDTFDYSVCDIGGRCSTAQVTVTVSWPIVVDRAISETTLQGSIASGDLTSTWSSDDVDEVLVERHSGGNPSQRTSALEHHWGFEVTGGSTVTFGVEAHRPDNSDGDDFAFAYSTDGGASWKHLVTIDSAVDNDEAVEIELPPNTSGSLLVRVTDTDPSTPGNGDTDSLHVDELYIVSSGPANQLPVITVSAPDDTAAEPDQVGVIRITRDDADGPLTVTYQLSGDATPGVDYVTPSGTAEFADGQAHVDVLITPIDDELAEPTEVVILQVEDGPGYVLGDPSAASVNIADDDGGILTVFADAELGVEGNVSGDFTATFSSDDQYQTITEVAVPQGKRSSLEHRWRFSVGTGGSATFGVEAYRTVGVDAFTWSYSTDGGASWNTMSLETTITSDDDLARTFTFPTPISGTLWVRVEDTDNAPQESTLDSLVVDQLVVTVS